MRTELRMCLLSFFSFSQDGTEASISVTQCNLTFSCGLSEKLKYFLAKIGISPQHLMLKMETFLIFNKGWPYNDYFVHTTQ